ncbi:hypothetical protein AOLI_G00124430 [Acnodon oligacanthus]
MSAFWRCGGGGGRNRLCGRQQQAAASSLTMGRGSGAPGDRWTPILRRRAFLYSPPSRNSSWYGREVRHARFLSGSPMGLMEHILEGLATKEGAFQGIAVHSHQLYVGPGHTGWEH